MPEREIRRLNQDAQSSLAGAIEALQSASQMLHEQAIVLRRHENDVQFIMDLLPALVAYVDSNCRYLRVNRTFEQWMERSASELQGLTMREVLGSEYVDRVQHHIEQALAGETVRFQSPVAYPKGGKIVEVTYSPDKASDGTVRGFAILVTDISERISREQESQRHAALLDQAMEPLLIWEIEGPIEYWNRAATELYGFTEEEALGQSSHTLLRTIHPQPLDNFLEMLSQSGLWEGELIHTTRDGRKITVDSRHLVVVQNGRQLVLESNRDITARKQLEQTLRDVNENLEQLVQQRTEQLVAANQELEAFSYSVSHDLRAPLRSIDGFGRILLRDFRDHALDERGVHLVERMSAATVRMGRLIEDLLQLSQITRTPIKEERVDLSALAAAVWDEISAHDSSRSVPIQIAPDMKVCGDGGLLRVVLHNLLSNARKFSSRVDQPKIEFGCCPAGDRLTYFVSDNGAGFDMAHYEQLFAPFQRLHSNGDFEGSGIGLALVQRIIRRHGGTITAESAPGAGARFLFTLPRRECA